MNFSRLVIFVFFTTLSIAAAAESPWRVSTGIYLEQDDNIELIPDDESSEQEINGHSTTVVLQAARPVGRLGSWHANFNTSGFYKHQWEDDASDYHVGGANAGLALSKAFQLKLIPTSARLASDLRQVWVGGSRFSMTTNLRGSLRLNVLPKLGVSTTLSTAVKRFADDGVDTGRTSRDATQYTLGLSAKYSFWLLPGGPELSLGYQHSENHARGNDFEFASNQLQVGFSTPLPLAVCGTCAPLRVNLGVSYLDSKYDAFTLEPRRDQDNLGANLSLSVPVTRQLTLGINAQFNNKDSNRAEYETERTRVSATINYRLSER